MRAAADNLQENTKIPSSSTAELLDLNKDYSKGLADSLTSITQNSHYMSDVRALYIVQLPRRYKSLFQ